jgi:hypothetical protein
VTVEFMAPNLGKERMETRIGYGCPIFRFAKD